MTNSAVTLGGVPVSAYTNSATQIAFAPSTIQLATVAQLPLVVTNPPPGGGSSNAVNFVVTTGTPTGSSSITFTASSGGLTHSQTFQLVVQ